MRFGCWTPLRGGEEGIDDHFELARQTLVRAEAHGFETSLVAERFIGAEYEAWVMASALSQHTSRMELIVETCRQALDGRQIQPVLYKPGSMV